ncbi:MAG: polysulfide reductase NrfD [Chloroflexi bacterium]|nr:polysulfide reductase NrfD [Chloroflexota bacterium]
MSVDGAYERRWETKRNRARSAGDEARDSYYSLPPIHAPHWKWLIVTYFYLGGLSSASSLVANIADVLGGPGNKRIARLGRYLSLATLLPCPLLLILDLGRPERFLNMLRVFKLRSPMSAGTWGLTVFGAFSTLMALVQAAEDGLLGAGRLERLLRALPVRALATLGLGPSSFVGGYTGVLLAATAVPFWTRNARLMGPLFLSSAVSSAAAAIALVLSLLPGTSARLPRRLENLDTFAQIMELSLLLGHEATLGPTVAQPLRRGSLGRLYRFGVLGIGLLAPLAPRMLSVVRGKGASRPTTILGSLLTLVGGYLLRYVVVMAGHQSANDPAATFETFGAGPSGS